MRETSLEVEIGKRLAFTIPFESVTALADVMETTHPVRGAQRALNDASVKWAGALSTDPDGAIFVAFVAAMDVSGLAILTPFRNIKGHDHSVYVFWTEGPEERCHEFPLRSDDALAVLTRLQEATGKTWGMITRNDHPQPGQQAASLFRITRSLQVGRSILYPGVYEAIVVLRSAHEGDLFFFQASSLDPIKLQARATVKILPLEESAENPEAVIQGSIAEARLVELPVRSKGVRLILQP